MIRKNLFLLEYMVKNRIEKDTDRLNAIRNVGGLLDEASIDLDKFENIDMSSFLNNLIELNKGPLSKKEYELIEEIFEINNKK